MPLALAPGLPRPSPPFNSLFEMRRAQPAVGRVGAARTFNSLFEMPRTLIL